MFKSFNGKPVLIRNRDHIKGKMYRKKKKIHFFVFKRDYHSTTEAALFDYIRFCSVGASGRLRRSSPTEKNAPLEMTVDIRTWPYLAKQGLGYLLSGSSKCELDVGFVIEGQADEELPEALLGGVHLNKIELDECLQWEDAI